jgi:hypothetical protein
MNFWKAFQIMGMLSEWLERAIMDGIIDQKEIIELITRVLAVLNVKAEIKVDMK